MAKEYDLTEYLKTYHCGELAAVTSRELETVFRIRGPDLRREINRLRADAVPICSCDHGYYYADTEEELQHTVNQLRSRIRMIAQAERGLTKALDKFTDNGQLSLLPEGGDPLE